MQQLIEEHKVELEQGKLLAKEFTTLYLNQSVTYDVTMKSYHFGDGEEELYPSRKRKEPSVITEISDKCRDQGVKVLFHEPGIGHLADFKVGRINVYLTQLNNDQDFKREIYSISSIGVEGDTVHMG